MAAVPLILMAVWLLLLGRPTLDRLIRLRKNRRASHHAKDWLLIDPFARVLEKSGIYEQIQLPLSSYHAKQVVLRGLDWSFDQTKRLLAAAAAYGYAAIAVCSLLAWIADEMTLMAMGIIIGVLLFLRPMLEAGRLIEKRKQAVILELPELLSKLMLLVGAGETVMQALIRCQEGKESQDHPLYKEWGKVVHSLSNGESFSVAAEKFNRSCSVQEVSIFTTVLLLNYRKGGEHFVLALRELSYSLWEKRKAVARSRGEEASSKLVFPLVGILLVLMVFVAAPAMLMMG
ncbi:type II secretion system F family protein [Paenibacillus gorillae]|uniref:type II secretion system F family protein n=1 Tax=Paenibacillus gorillae TaxID=1243662 RepID=UPI0004B30F37|nr:type II secretion system F family protein [Paenibacillus gorillae]